MEKLSAIKESSRFPVCIEIKPYLMDHRFLNNAVLPAVEIMQVMARCVKDQFVQTNIHILKNASFNKFLMLTLLKGQNQIDAFVDITIFENNDIEAVLVTKLKSKTGSLTRSLTHAALNFSNADTPQNNISAFKPDMSKQLFFEVSSDVIYRHLVPFGPSFHNLIGILKISQNSVIGQVQAVSKNLDHGPLDLLGSPFPLDAAFHAACVWGQRYESIIAFPIGFEKRIIYKATCPGHIYNILVLPVKTDVGVLFFDLWIYDDANQVYETVKMLAMKDVSGGQTLPPKGIVDGMLP